MTTSSPVDVPVLCTRGRLVDAQTHAVDFHRGTRLGTRSHAGCSRPAARVGTAIGPAGARGGSAAGARGAALEDDLQTKGTERSVGICVPNTLLRLPQMGAARGITALPFAAAGTPLRLVGGALGSGDRVPQASSVAAHPSVAGRGKDGGLSRPTSGRHPNPNPNPVVAGPQLVGEPARARSEDQLVERAAATLHRHRLATAV
ncbi:hypothetical protein B2J93_9435 [Marssonina coronariae]|uniref:Uncharacterized protein n=1 Tax=Diplocarpon coronariae TaxID=2795749 RepID=A0A218YV73_9HELO|nr:hypothetical protein B2J93_9435 [Marssonina coronariae]